MATNNCKNQPTATSGKILQGQGVGTASNFSTATYPATVASGDVITATSTNVVGSLVVPTNRWQVGSRLNYSGSAPAWMNFAKDIYIYDDWISNASSGWLGWNTTNGGSATITVNDFVSTTVVGNVSLNTGTSSFSQAVIQLGDTLHAMTFGGGRCVITWLAKLSRLSTSGARYGTHIGYINQGADYPTTTVSFYYEDSVNSGNWQLIAKDNSSTTTTNSSTAADTNWHKFTIDVNAGATSAEFFIDGTSLGTVTSNIPQASGSTHTCQPGCFIANGSAAISTSSTLILDAMWMYQSQTNQR